MEDNLTTLQFCLLSVVAGICLGVGFVWTILWPVAILGVALFVFLVNKAGSLKKILVVSFLTAFIKSLLVIFWFWSVYPIRWLDLSLGAAELPLIGFYWLTVSLFISIGGIFLALLFWFVKRKLNLLLGLLIFPTLLVLSEVVGAVFFSIFTSGPGSSINTLYSFGSLGYLFGYNSSIITLANFGGVYVLSFFMATLGYLLWLVFYYFSHKKTLVFAVFLLCAAVFSGFNNPSTNVNLPGKTITVAVVDTRFGDEFFKRGERDTYKLEQLNEAVKAAVKLNTDYILLPEDSRYVPGNISAEMAYRLFRFQNSDPRAILIDSGTLKVLNNETYLRSTVYDGISKRSWVADKQYLVPQGEYLPYFTSVTLKLVGMKKTEEIIAERLSFRPGPLSPQVSFPSHIPAILFCFESADPLSVRRLVKERDVPFVAHLVSHAWFHESEVLWQQLDSMLKIQAIWNGVPIISAGNMVKGSMYTERGEKIQKSPVATGESWQVSLFEL